jgi:hypothetical protein
MPRLNLTLSDKQTAFIASEAERLGVGPTVVVQMWIAERMGATQAVAARAKPAKPVPVAPTRRPKMNPSGDPNMSPDEAEFAAWQATPIEELSMGWNAWITAYRDRNKPAPMQPWDASVRYALPDEFEAAMKKAANATNPTHEDEP